MIHRFLAVNRDRETLNCVGTCTCGYATVPDNDRDIVWDRICEHVMHEAVWPE